ncbi:MAG: undecaprenyl/decaprenyl-phosphate alpha-N-acetylglucosaminyl 1-phosphate transferase [Pirellulales bacterium]|nr:undecaprenyl/decaprenyl-phosphate alpha-N-acetylglucosaminyl 1-phosphate transferase [Pirellulales bacterium]
MNLGQAFLIFAAALAGSLTLTPLIARCASRHGAVDAPDGRRKKQPQAVPLGGGLAVALAVAAALTLVMALDGQFPAAAERSLIQSALPSIVVLLLVGVLDDLVGLTGIYKLIGQTLSASLLVAAGFRFEDVSMFGASLPLGDFSVPFSLFFCLGAINAFNLIDGADALAASIGAVVLLTLGVVAAAQGMAVATLISFAASGALVGFLRYNAPPARIYLGDTGSMFIGWVVAAVAIRCSIKEQAAVALTVPIAICAIPILDSGAAIIRRITTGQSVFTADRGHLHHALLLHGWSAGQTAAMAAGLTAITCAGAVASFFTRNDLFAMVASVAVFAALAGTRVFGHAELALVASHLRTILRRLPTLARAGRRPAADQPGQAIQLQGRRPWSVLWTALEEAAQAHHLAGAKLVVNIPHLHESFYASWKRPDVRVTDACWRVTLPLSLADRPIGRLLLLGSCGGPEGLAEMQRMLDFLEPLDDQIAHIANGAGAAAPFKLRPASDVSLAPEAVRRAAAAASIW